MSGKLPLAGGRTGWSKLRDFTSPFPNIWMKKPYVSLPTTSSTFFCCCCCCLYTCLFFRTKFPDLCQRASASIGISTLDFPACEQRSGIPPWRRDYHPGQSLWPLDDWHQTGMAIGFASAAAALRANVLLGNSCSRGNLSSLLRLPSKHWMSSFLLQTALLWRWTETFSACPQMSGKLK